MTLFLLTLAYISPGFKFVKGMMGVRPTTSIMLESLATMTSEAMDYVGIRRLCISDLDTMD